MTTPTGTTASVARTLTLIDKDAARGSSCSPDLTRGPWAFDAGLPAYGPGASQDDAVPADAPVQGRIPEEYQRASDEELHARISAARQTLGERVVVLGHF
ncbi:MAG TPA: quinolinate synthase, partial [Micrococcus luteus]|nr:quinolinate synthase [Micrococcus luteus]